MIQRFFLPGPPNFFLSKHILYLPQSLALRQFSQRLHCRFLFERVHVAARQFSLNMVIQGRRKQFVSGTAIGSSDIAGISTKGWVIVTISVRKHAKSRGVWGHAPPKKILKFATSKTLSGEF